jgi:hypothetical protein
VEEAWEPAIVMETIAIVLLSAASLAVAALGIRTAVRAIRTAAYREFGLARAEQPSAFALVLTANITASLFFLGLAIVIAWASLHPLAFW